ncbi:uncharacterized protein LACBIDRAFT_316234 [Laccaria bicolor S238N-H82]|uniref:Predicted protein n=1 Tax=Laccaria bicolor (strain S238N-H82 / ATCC MYA-4686) TaxID=486041 RepID=B0E0H9_LACBS|nr:uncharacterized protein LACBIDRAFT_316234 [Laccaria bicolor S238N-H82]EDQ99721.1 predicted protein [Laccaria bicolor S238N-H82]|eukprot:XP_001889698.1 predicted protein [Laccaria bicolor S238N-H82]
MVPGLAKTESNRNLVCLAHAHCQTNNCLARLSKHNPLSSHHHQPLLPPPPTSPPTTTNLSSHHHQPLLPPPPTSLLLINARLLPTHATSPWSPVATTAHKACQPPTTTTSTTTRQRHVSKQMIPGEVKALKMDHKGQGTTTSTHDHHDHAHGPRHAPRCQWMATSTDANANDDTHHHVNGPPPRQRTTTTPTDNDHANRRPRQQTPMLTDTHVNAQRRAPDDGNPRCHVAVSDMATK